MSQQTACVLYIDDDPGFARLVEKAILRAGYSFVHAPTGEAGLARIAEGGVDVVALDHYLSTGTGLDVLETLGQGDEHPPVVYVTGSAETAVAVAALKAGAVDYVTKSVDPEFFELLARAIGNGLNGARARQEKLRAEQDVREARDRAEMLLGEVNHRVANSLAMVAALVGLQSNALEDAAAKSALAETQARISAIAGVHRHLYISHDVRTVQLGEYLQSLVGELDATMAAGGQRSRIRLEIEGMPIATERAASLGVIVTELVTNAVKYAYAGREQGEVRVRMARRDNDLVHLEVEDDGIGWNGTGTPQGTGLGSRIVKAMALSLGAKVSYRSEGRGTQVSLQFLA